jgi:hypothetical protein
MMQFRSFLRDLLTDGTHPNRHLFAGKAVGQADKDGIEWNEPDDHQATPVKVLSDVESGRTPWSRATTRARHTRIGNQKSLSHWPASKNTATTGPLLHCP